MPFQVCQVRGSIYGAGSDFSNGRNELMAVKVTIGSVTQRVADEETTENESLEVAVAALQEQIEEEIEGTDFYDDGEEEAARREFIAKIGKPSTFADFEKKKSLSFEYGDTNYNPIKVTFELTE
jgi:hypothetical protein